MKPEIRREQIVAEARELFIHSGYAELSLRAVSARCNIRLSTVQHYFPTRAELVDAMIDSLTAEYMVHYDSLAQDKGLSAYERLTRTIETLLVQNEDQETAFFFPELWALAERDPAAAAAMDRLYNYGRELLSTLLQECAPELERSDALRCALLLMALADGLLLTVGIRHRHVRINKVDRRRLVEDALGLAAHFGVRPVVS